MTGDELDLAFVWAWFVAFAVLAYAMLDGFDLGIGILTLGSRRIEDRESRGQMMASIAPVWDGNETWLVFGGAALFAAFPLAYSLLLTAFYAPLIAMLLALIFRGVAFEFRGRTPRAQRLWEIGFGVGSAVAAFCQGIMVGAFLQGIAVDGRRYAGGWFDWLTPFSVLTGATLLLGYALLGAAWLNLKTSGALQARIRGAMPALAMMFALAIAAISAWTPFIDPAYATRWFAWPHVLYTAPIPATVVTLVIALLGTLRRGRELAPFLLVEALFAVTFAGLGVSVYPYIVPRAVTIWQAAAPFDSQLFLLVGAGVLVPIIVGYTAHAYWVFRGKVRAESGYHP